MYILLHLCIRGLPVILAFIPLWGSAQPQADFAVNKAQGCSPHLVTFTDQSSGNVNNRQWYFGNGGTSDTTTPIASYVNPGTYDVSLVVSNAQGQDSITKEDFITVFENPTAAFTVDQNGGCVPLSVNFQDQTNLGDAAISNWLWDFGDGTTSNQNNPGHTYQIEGTYSVSLEVEDQNGCKDVVSKTDLIDVQQAPQTDFTSDIKYGCEPPFEVNFSNQSTGGSNVNYEWKFGDGQSSSNKNPSHTYQNYGQFDVELIATSNGGCGDTITKTNFIIVDTLESNMYISQKNGCLKPNITEFQFIDSTMPHANMHSWNFGDGFQVNGNYITHTYNSPGNYQVTLITGNQSCKDTLVDSVHVQQVTADYNLDTLKACKPPLTVNFSDKSFNADSWQWNFDNGNTSNQQNPSQTFNSFGEYDISLVVTNPSGCIDSIQKRKVVIQEPTASIFTDKEEGCAPLQTNLQSSIQAIGQVKGTLWDLGEGDTATTPDTSKVFQDTGVYQVTLKATTNLGCEATEEREIQVGNPPTGDFSINPDTGCVGESLTLNPTTDFADKRKWKFRKNAPLKVNIPHYQYRDTGNYDVTLYLSHNGCQGDTIIKENYIKIEGPRAGFVTNQNCDNHYAPSFTDTSILADTLKWKFGDGDSAFIPNPTHSYGQRGSYPVTLTVSNVSTGCTTSVSKDVVISEPRAKFTASDSLSCPPFKNLQLDADSSVDVAGLSYFWEYGNGQKWGPLDTNDRSLLKQPPSPNYDTGGIYDIQLVVLDLKGCPDTATKSIQVFNHDTKIGANAFRGCDSLEVDFEDQTVTDTTITSREWQFGTGDSSSVNKPSYNYNSTGTYPVTLITEDTLNCKDTATREVTITSPSAFFFATSQDACQGEEIRFVSSSSGNSLQLEWYFGDTTTATGKLPFHSYNYSDTFDVDLVITDNNQCKDTFTRKDYIRINDPVSQFIADTLNAACPPFLVNFENRTKGQNFDAKWKFGDKSGSVLNDPTHNYTRPGSYDVSLITSNKSGCADTLTKKDYIQIGGPDADYTVTPTQGCKPLKVQFNNFNQKDVETTTWDFGDGKTQIGDTVVHNYQNYGEFEPTMILSNNRQGNLECEYGLPLDSTIVIDTVDANFTLSSDSICEQETVSLTNQEVGAIQSREWQLDQDSTFSSKSPGPFKYDSFGNYSIQLKVTTNKGCKDSTEKEVRVNPIPSIQASGGGFVCEGDSLQLNATDDPDYQYSWQPKRGLNDPQLPYPIAAPDSSTQYQVQVTDENNCQNESEKVQVTVQERPKLTIFSDTTIVIGDSADLRASTDYRVKNYRWQPADSLVCDTCQNTRVHPAKNTTYKLQVEDTADCFVVKDAVLVKVEDNMTLDVPGAFTPNNDGNNDQIFVRGWAIKDLIYFKIYNRWGELMFETTNLEEGWDGKYRGTVQNQETYFYRVKAKSITGEVKAQKGSFTLIR